MQETEVWNKVVGLLMVLKDLPSHATHLEKCNCDVSTGSDEERWHTWRDAQRGFF